MLSKRIVDRIRLFFILKGKNSGGFMVKKLLCILCLVICSIMFVGCSGKSGGSSSRSVDPPPVVSNAASESIDIDMYVDGTYSMAGYVNFPHSTLYSDGIKNIERTITSGWKKENIQYIKFGDGNEKLSRSQFLESNHPSFYQELDTSLQNVISDMDPNKMNIVITDLFQTNQDIDSLVMELKKQSFSDAGKALALIGIKSQFNGKIYDIGKNRLSVDYKTTEDTATYRPFYIMVMGKENDVRLLVDGFKKNFGNDDLCKVAMFSRNFGTDVRLIAGKSISNSKNKDGEKIANMAKMSTMLGSNSDVLQYRLKLDEKLSGFNCRLEAHDVLCQVPEKFTNFSVNVEKWEQKKADKQNADFIDKVTGNTKTAVGQPAFTQVKIDDLVAISGGEIEQDGTTVSNDLRFVFDSKAIKRKEGKYRACVALRPSKEDYIVSNNVFDEWNVKDEAVLSADALSFVGSKTLNISSFVQVISALNYEMNEPGFYNIYVYFEAIK